MISRRGLFGGAIVGGLASLAGKHLVSESTPSHDTELINWDQQVTAQHRAANDSELQSARQVAEKAAVQFGCTPEEVAIAAAIATVSLTPRGTEVSRCALQLSEEFVFVSTQEHGKGRYDRSSSHMYMTDNASFVREIAPFEDAQARSLQKRAARLNCCTPPTGPLGQCCEFNWNGLIQCCGPCAFGGFPAGLACAIIWCYACVGLNCKQWWRRC